MKFKYDPKHLGKGYYSCRSCGNVFAAGIKPFHCADCSDAGEGWNVAVYNFGKEELEEIEGIGRSSNNPDLTIRELESIKIV
ncbi:MAG: hypothetical protein WC438_04470 [Candidatus Pacearchaeota archaeon]